MRFALPLVTICLAAYFLAGCDLSERNGSVSGRVVDIVSGEPLHPGKAKLTLYGSSFALFPPVIAEDTTQANGYFQISGFDGSPSLLQFGGTGTIDYPYPEPVSGAFLPTSRAAYHPTSMHVDGGNIGTTELAPTCFTLGRIHLTRPLGYSDLLSLSMRPPADVPQVRGGFSPPTTSVSINSGGIAALDALPLLSFGGFPAMLHWRTDSASGVVRLPECPRHGVLEYEVTIGAASEPLGSARG